MVEVRINMDIMKLLKEMGYDTYKNTDSYILAPTHQHSRATMISNISKGFHEYMKLVLPDKDFQLKDLRKTNITQDGKSVGKERASKRVHGDMSTTEGHYFDEHEMLPTANEKPTCFKGVALSEL